LKLKIEAKGEYEKIMVTDTAVVKGQKYQGLSSENSPIVSACPSVMTTGGMTKHSEVQNVR
jgi:hypothetical protein